VTCLLSCFKNRKSIFSRLAALNIVFFHLLNSAAWAAPGLPLNQMGSASFPQSLESLSLPTNLGKVEDVFISSRCANNQSDCPKVFYLQDAHANLGAQENIHAIMAVLSKQFGVHTILTEGASGTADLDHLREFTDQEIKKLAVKFWLQNVVITGFEAEAILSQKPYRLIGIEDRALYIESKKWFVQALDQQNQILPQLKSLMTKLLNERKKIGHPAWLQFEEKIDLYENKHNLISLISHLWDTGRDLGVKRIDLGHLDKMISLVLIEKSIESGENKEEEFIRLSKAIESAALFHEIEILKQRIRARLLTNPQEHKVHQAIQLAKALEKMALLQATPQEIAFLGRFKPDVDLLLNSHYIHPELIYSARNFYRTNRARETVFLQTIRETTQNQKEPIFLVTGGFHSQSLVQSLRESGISYALVTPQVSEETDFKRYYERMHGESFDGRRFEKMFKRFIKSSAILFPLYLFNPSFATETGPAFLHDARSELRQTAWLPLQTLRKPGDQAVISPRHLPVVIAISHPLVAFGQEWINLYGNETLLSLTQQDFVFKLKPLKTEDKPVEELPLAPGRPFNWHNMLRFELLNISVLGGTAKTTTLIIGLIADTLLKREVQLSLPNKKRTVFPVIQSPAVPWLQKISEWREMWGNEVGHPDDVTRWLAREAHHVGDIVVEVGASSFPATDIFDHKKIILIDVGAPKSNEWRSPRSLLLRGNIEYPELMRDIKNVKTLLELEESEAANLDELLAGQVDSVILPEVLNYVDSPRVISRVKSWLKPGGRLFIYNNYREGIGYLFSKNRLPSNELVLRLLELHNFKVESQTVTTSGTFQLVAVSKAEEGRSELRSFDGEERSTTLLLGQLAAPVTEKEKVILNEGQVSSQMSLKMAVKNRLGLHARPSMGVVEFSNLKLFSEIDFQIKAHYTGENREPQQVSAKSIMHCMMLAATQGTVLHFFAGEPEKILNEWVPLVYFAGVKLFLNDFNAGEPGGAEKNLPPDFNATYEDIAEYLIRSSVTQVLDAREKIAEGVIANQNQLMEFLDLAGRLVPSGSTHSELRTPKMIQHDLSALRDVWRTVPDEVEAGFPVPASAANEFMMHPGQSFSVTQEGIETPKIMNVTLVKGEDKTVYLDISSNSNMVAFDYFLIQDFIDGSERAGQQIIKTLQRKNFKQKIKLNWENSPLVIADMSKGVVRVLALLEFPEKLLSHTNRHIFKVHVAHPKVHFYDATQPLIPKVAIQSVLNRLYKQLARPGQMETLPIVLGNPFMTYDFLRLAWQSVSGKKQMKDFTFYLFQLLEHPEFMALFEKLMEHISKIILQDIETRFENQYFRDLMKGPFTQYLLSFHRLLKVSSHPAANELEDTISKLIKTIWLTYSERHISQAHALLVEKEKTTRLQLFKAQEQIEKAAKHLDRAKQFYKSSGRTYIFQNQDETLGELWSRLDSRTRRVARSAKGQNKKELLSLGQKARSERNYRWREATKEGGPLAVALYLKIAGFLIAEGEVHLRHLAVRYLTQVISPAGHEVLTKIHSRDSNWQIQATAVLFAVFGIGKQGKRLGARLKAQLRADKSTGKRENTFRILEKEIMSDTRTDEEGKEVEGLPVSPSSTLPGSNIYDAYVFMSALRSLDVGFQEHPEWDYDDKLGEVLKIYRALFELKLSDQNPDFEPFANKDPRLLLLLIYLSGALEGEQDHLNRIIQHLIETDKLGAYLRAHGRVTPEDINHLFRRDRWMSQRLRGIPRRIFRDILTRVELVRPEGRFHGILPDIRQAMGGEDLGLVLFDRHAPAEPLRNAVAPLAHDGRFESLLAFQGWATHTQPLGEGWSAEQEISRFAEMLAKGEVLLAKEQYTLDEQKWFGRILMHFQEDIVKANGQIHLEHFQRASRQESVSGAHVIIEFENLLSARLSQDALSALTRAERIVWAGEDAASSSAIKIREKHAARFQKNIALFNQMLPQVVEMVNAAMLARERPEALMQDKPLEEFPPPSAEKIMEILRDLYPGSPFFIDVHLTEMGRREGEERAPIRLVMTKRARELYGDISEIVLPDGTKLPVSYHEWINAAENVRAPIDRLADRKAFDQKVPAIFFNVAVRGQFKPLPKDDFSRAALGAFFMSKSAALRKKRTADVEWDAHRIFDHLVKLQLSKKTEIYIREALAAYLTELLKRASVAALQHETHTSSGGEAERKLRFLVASSEVEPDQLGLLFRDFITSGNLNRAVSPRVLAMIAKSLIEGVNNQAIADEFDINPAEVETIVEEGIEKIKEAFREFLAYTRQEKVLDATFKHETGDELKEVMELLRKSNRASINLLPNNKGKALTIKINYKGLERTYYYVLHGDDDSTYHEGQMFIRFTGRKYREYFIRSTGWFDPIIRSIFEERFPNRFNDSDIAFQKPYFLINKPKGAISAVERDPLNLRAPVVGDLLPDNAQKRVSLVDQLDRRSVGLMLAGPDQFLNAKVMNIGHEKEETYELTLRGFISDELLNQLLEGINIRRAISEENPPFIVKAKKIRVTDRNNFRTVIHLTLNDGTYFQIKKMADALGSPILRLRRIKLGHIHLGALPDGAWRYLTNQELRNLIEMNNQDVQAEGDEKRSEFRLVPAASFHAKTEGYILISYHELMTNENLRARLMQEIKSNQFAQIEFRILAPEFKTGLEAERAVQSLSGAADIFGRKSGQKTRVQLYARDRLGVSRTLSKQQAYNMAIDQARFALDAKGFTNQVVVIGERNFLESLTRRDVPKIINRAHALKVAELLILSDEAFDFKARADISGILDPTEAFLQTLGHAALIQAVLDMNA